MIDVTKTYKCSRCKAPVEMTHPNDAENVSTHCDSCSTEAIARIKKAKEQGFEYWINPITRQREIKQTWKEQTVGQGTDSLSDK